MQTIATNRIEDIRAVLDNVSFEIEKDASDFPKMVAFEYDTKALYLDCYMYFDGSESKGFDLMIDGINQEFTKEEKDLIYVRLCQQHKTAFDSFEEDKREDAYKDMIAKEDQDTIDYISANFYSQY